MLRKQIPFRFMFEMLRIEMTNYNIFHPWQLECLTPKTLMFCQLSALMRGEKIISYLRTATFVRAETVLTTVLTPRVVIALVVVDTESPSLVQLVSPGTDTAEASLRVLASSRGGTETLLLLETLVNIQAAVSVLLISGPTHADKAALRVDTVLLAVVLILTIVSILHESSRHWNIFTVEHSSMSRQVRPSLLSWKPGGQRHLKDPRVL